MPQRSTAGGPHAVLGYDTNGDGQLDAFDTNQDGAFDTRVGGGRLSAGELRRELTSVWGGADGLTSASELRGELSELHVDIGVSTSRKRRQYEMFLSKVKLFEALTSDELVTRHDLQITMRCLSGSHWRRLSFASDSWANRGSPGASGRLARGHHVPGRRYFDAGGRRGRLLLHLHQGHSLRDQQQSAPPPATAVCDLRAVPCRTVGRPWRRARALLF